MLLPLLLLLVVTGCKLSEPSHLNSADSMNLGGQTGRNLTIEVEGLRQSKSQDGKHSVCAIGLAGNEVMSNSIAEKRLVCSSQIDQIGHVSIRLTDLPYPAYITVFHDRNNNRILDFAAFNYIVGKTISPAEGVGSLEMEDHSIKFSRPAWVEVGEQKTKAILIYEDSPFWKFVKEKSWNVFLDWYLEMAFKVNHPGRPKSPYPDSPKDP